MECLNFVSPIFETKVSLSLSISKVFFEIENRNLPSHAPVPGLGPLTLNYHNNGTLDLVVANGHIEKAIDLNAPFLQPAQLFRNA